MLKNLIKIDIDNNAVLFSSKITLSFPIISKNSSCCEGDNTIKRNIIKSVKLASKVTTCSLHNTIGQCHQYLMRSFCSQRSQKHKKTLIDNLAG